MNLEIKMKDLKKVRLLLLIVISLLQNNTAFKNARQLFFWLKSSIGVGTIELHVRHPKRI